MPFKKKKPSELMVKTHWFVTQDQKQKIERWAKVRQTTESDIIRQLIDKNASK